MNPCTGLPPYERVWYENLWKSQSNSSRKTPPKWNFTSIYVYTQTCTYVCVNTTWRIQGTCVHIRLHVPVTHLYIHGRLCIASERTFMCNVTRAHVFNHTCAHPCTYVPCVYMYVRMIRDVHTYTRHMYTRTCLCVHGIRVRCTGIHVFTSVYVTHVYIHVCVFIRTCHIYACVRTSVCVCVRTFSPYLLLRLMK